MTSPSFPWSGRTDSQETGVSTRWHQHVRSFTPESAGGCTLIGFAVDEGVRRNEGRVGAAQGPDALRRALGSMPVLGEPAIFDMGNVDCHDGALEAAQSRLADRIAEAIGCGTLPVVMGGGHEVAWGSFQGIMAARPDLERLLIVNIDAHFDLRMAEEGNSGTTFRQMQENCAAAGKAFNYRVLGISRFANTQGLFDRADAFGARYWLDETLQDGAGVAAALQELSADMRDCEAIYLTICLDVLPAAVAPGVSAPSPLGVPLAQVETIIDSVARSGKLISADIAELNPGLDRDSQTAKAAARLVARIVRSRGPS